MKQVVLPLHSRPMCGHSFPGLMWGDLAMGREESIRVIEHNGVEYVANTEYGPCSKCNAAEDARIMREIKDYEATQRSARSETEPE